MRIGAHVLMMSIFILGCDSGNGDGENDTEGEGSITGSWFYCADNSCQEVNTLIGVRFQEDGRVAVLNWLYGAPSMQGEWAYCVKSYVGTYTVDGNVINAVSALDESQKYTVNYTVDGDTGSFEGFMPGIQDGAVRRLDEASLKGECTAACEELTTRVQGLMDEAAETALTDQAVCSTPEECSYLQSSLCQAALSVTAAQRDAATEFETAMNDIQNDFCDDRTLDTCLFASPSEFVLEQELLCTDGQCVLGE